VLTFLMEVLEIPSAAGANVVAAAFGISTSFLGSRYFVFRNSTTPLIQQIGRFGALYVAIAVLHGLILFGWTDVFKLNYRIGFLIATGLQIILSFFGNKRLVFDS